jgi:hypothetical protein
VRSITRIVIMIIAIHVMVVVVVIVIHRWSCSQSALRQQSAE